jgi:hypothetical protein
LVLVSRGCGSGKYPSLQLAQRGYAREQPIELGVLGDVRLDEHDAPLRIEAGRVETDRHIERQLRETGGVVRLGDGVQVDDTEQAVVLRL